MSHRLVAACLAAALACGHEPAPSPTPSPTPPDTGGTPPGNPPPSNPPPANPPDNPNPPPATPPPANPPPGNPPPANPPPGDPSVTIRRLDDAAECDGLVPASAPQAVTADAPGAGENCGSGISEGGGHVAVVRHFGQGFQEVQVFAPDGTPEQRFSATAFPGACAMSGCVPVFPQQDGFQVTQGENGIAGISTQSHVPLTVHVQTYAADGSLRHDEIPTPPDDWTRRYTAAADPLGGVLVVAQGSPPPDVGSWCRGRVFRFGNDGSLRGTGATTCEQVGAAVSNRGESLVIVARPDQAPGQEFLDWLNPDGTAAASEAAIGTPWYSFARFLAPLLDGGIAANDGTTWQVVYPRLGASTRQPPDWLMQRRGWSFRFTRGNRGYALFPPTGQQLADCDPGLELRAPSGRLCGTITFREEGGACTTRALDQGWDGTVIQQSARGACHYRWWPRLLARE
ncbi:MAG TPA: hypothetical protein VFK90_17070 [Anaeromyxobacter sp.]|nr:hypothetical protein [Anaeromyxobacter sp.]